MSKKKTQTHEDQFGKMERHPLSQIFHNTDDLHFDDLKQSILEIGQQEPILLSEDGKIVDGWRRWRAIRQLVSEGHEIGTPWFEPTDDPYKAVFARHIAKRNLPPKERARAIKEMEQWRLANEPGSKPKTERQLAKEADVSKTTMHNVINEDKTPKKETTKTGKTAKTDANQRRSGAKKAPTETDESGEATETTTTTTVTAKTERKLTKLEQAEHDLLVAQGIIQDRDTEIGDLRERIAHMEEGGGNSGTLKRVQAERDHLRRDKAMLQDQLRKKDWQIKTMQKQLEEVDG